jgi:hypothetical protein
MRECRFNSTDGTPEADDRRSELASRARRQSVPSSIEFVPSNPPLSKNDIPDASTAFLISDGDNLPVKLGRRYGQASG